MPDRRLAAILAADIVGYSALMAEDEAGTLEALRRLRRELFHPAVAGHRGKVVKAMGDGWLVEFASAVDAVNCAVQVQSGLEADPKIRVRIGIHVGDITHEDEDIYGYGVNVAARLEALAEPGAIWISDAIYGALDGTLRPSFDDTGEQRLKNIPLPMRVWKRTAASETVSRRPDEPANPQRAGFPVIVSIGPVLTNDRRPEVLELAAALTGDLFTYLDNGRWLAAQVSENAPSGSYVLKTTLRARGDRLRLDVSLTAPNGEMIWSRRFDGSLDDSFDWQDQTVGMLSSGALAAISEAETDRLARVPDQDKTAADWLLVPMIEFIVQADQFKSAFAAVRSAIARDPSWGLPYAFGAHYGMFAAASGLVDGLESYTKVVDEWIDMARQHADGDLLTELYAASAEHRRRPALDRLRTKIDATLRRHPYHETALYVGTMACLYAGEPTVALDYSRKTLASTAAARDAARAYTAIGAACIRLGRDQEALDALRRALDVAPTAPLILRPFAAAAALNGCIDEAHAAIAALGRVSSGLTIAAVRRQSQYADTPGTRRYFDGLRLAGLPEGEE